MTELILICIGIFLIGTILGSFISVLIHRIQNNQKGIFFGRSECPNCNTILTAKDLVPVFSYLFLKGKCRHCLAKISPMYPTLELISGLTLLLTFLKFNTNPLIFASWSTIFILGIAISFYDIQTQEIPLKLSIPLGVFSFFASAFVFNNSWQSILLGAALGFGFFYFQYAVSKGTWTGLGDADLGLIIGILFGPFLLLQTLIISYILGASFGIYLLIKTNSGLKTRLAFGPFLMLGLLINALFSTQIQNLIFPYI
jgi:prepilin signal peptidase PulO-like enzyme (type II secretory pathway)